MDFVLKNKMDELFEFQTRLINASLDNLTWSCLYSGLGMISPLSKKEAETLTHLESEASKVDFYLKNYVPICCIYAAGIPTYAVPSKEILNPGCFMWDDKNHKKNLEIETQAYAIVSLCLAYHAMVEENKYEKTFIDRTARLIYDFVSSYMRNDDGLYVNGEDKSKLTDKNKKIKLDTKKTSLYAQITMLEAVISLHSLTTNIPSELCSKQSGFCNFELEADNLLIFIENNLDEYLDQSTKMLSSSISSLYRSINSCTLTSKKDKMVGLVMMLTAELATRVRLTGETEKNSINTEIASLMTHFKTASALMEGYHLTNIKQFRDVSLTIHKNLVDLYDPITNNFHNCLCNEVSYTISDIADILKSLLLHYKCTNDQHSLKLFKETYYSCIEKTCLIQSVSSNTINVMDSVKAKYEFNNTLRPSMNEHHNAPVFLKGFKQYFNNKEPNKEISKYFSSRHALYSTLIFLHYLDRV